MNKTLFTTVALLFVVFTSLAQSKDEKAILELMREEERAWNSGNIEAYVDLYAAHDSTRMIYSSGAVYGKDSILAFYKNTGQKKEWDSLRWMVKDWKGYRMNITTCLVFFMCVIPMAKVSMDGFRD